MISVPALPHYSWGGVLPLSFIVQPKANLWHSSLSAQTTGVSNPLHSLSLRPSTSVIVSSFLYLVFLFFISDLNFFLFLEFLIYIKKYILIHRGLPSPLSVLSVSKDFIPYTNNSEIFLSHIKLKCNRY